MSGQWKILLMISSCFFFLGVTAKVKIFILAGQSNMVGVGSIEHLKELGMTDSSLYGRYFNTTTTTKQQFRTLPGVRMAYNSQDPSNSANEKIILTDLVVGKTTPSGTSFGPEIGFAWTLKPQYSSSGDQILILKYALNSSSLAVNWRPPSAGYSSVSGTSSIVGKRYREMVAMVHDATRNLGKYVPGHGNDGYEIDGFLWLQGWYDSGQTAMMAEYKSNLKHLISDVRSEFNVPDLPFFIGELGQGGNPIVADSAVAFVIPLIQSMRTIEKQVADSMDSNVVFVPTSQYVVNGQKKFDGIHHYYGRADTHLQIGIAFGRAYLQLLADGKGGLRSRRPRSGIYSSVSQGGGT